MRTMMLLLTALSLTVCADAKPPKKRAKASPTALRRSFAPKMAPTGGAVRIGRPVRLH